MGSSLLERSGHRVVTYDARGHGRSSPAPQRTAYGYEDLQDDLEGVLDALEIERPVLAGASMTISNTAANTQTASANARSPWIRNGRLAAAFATIPVPMTEANQLGPRRPNTLGTVGSSPSSVVAMTSRRYSGSPIRTPEASSSVAVGGIICRLQRAKFLSRQAFEGSRATTTSNRLELTRQR